MREKTEYVMEVTDAVSEFQYYAFQVDQGPFKSEDDAAIYYANAFCENNSCALWAIYKVFYNVHRGVLGNVMAEGKIDEND